MTNERPVILSREALTSFSDRFERLYKQELQDLYTKQKGDISIFRRKSFYKVSVDMIADDELHLKLTLPYKLGSAKGRKISSSGKQIYQIAKDIAHKNKGRVFLRTVLIIANDSLELEITKIADLIFDFVQRELLVPMPLEELKKKFTIHN
ncbi:MAG: hypothetical protein ACFFB0_04540 [Promethearchaeota archaeon]